MKNNGKVSFLFIIGFFLISFQIVIAQTYNYQFLISIKIDVNEIKTDKLGNLYIVSKSNQLYKYNSEGKLLCTLNYSYSGNISSIDVSNPLEIYLFYKELNTIVFLDNNLAFRGEINLSNFGISQASAIARSYDNGIWLFDIADLQLKKMNKDGNITLQSSNVRQFRNYAKNVLPNYIYDNNDKLYLNDSAVGVMVFDVFANYIKLINIAHLCNFKIIDDELFYIKQNTLFSYNLKTLSYNGNALPSSRPLECSVEKDRLYLMYENNVEIYKMW